MGVVDRSGITEGKEKESRRMREKKEGKGKENNVTSGKSMEMKEKQGYEKGGNRTI